MRFGKTALIGPVISPDLEAAAERQSIRRGLRIGGYVWPLFTVLDLYMWVVLYPSAPILLFLAYRIALEVAMVWVYRQTARPDRSIRFLTLSQNVLFSSAALIITLMAVHLGGLDSIYMQGISLACLIRAAIVPEPWQDSLSTFLPMGLAYPFVMGVAAFFSPAIAAQWRSPESLAHFGAGFVFVAASTVVGLASGHAVWAARQQVYKARRLGRYRLQAPIGKGGMGDVWLAWDGSLRRNVALKILRSDYRGGAASVRRFEREAQSASRLRVPHTIQVYDFGASDDGIYYIAMEFLPGIDLNRLVKAHGPQPAARAIHFMRQACLSLEEAHAAGIIHRDIKPQNLFLTLVGDTYDFIKLLDFGIARSRVVGEAVDQTQTGIVHGTPQFLAPEVCQGATADERSDIYAIGGTLYFLLTGQPPFDAGSVEGVMRAHLSVEAQPPSARSPLEIPPALDALVLRCLAKNPDHRYQSARDLLAALDAVEPSTLWTPTDARAFWIAAGFPTAGADTDASGENAVSIGTASTIERYPQGL